MVDASEDNKEADDEIRLASSRSDLTRCNWRTATFSAVPGIQTWVLGLGLIFASTSGRRNRIQFRFQQQRPGSTFAYEGIVAIDGSKVTGSYDMKFTVVDASAAEHDFELTGVSVSDE